MDFFFTAFLFVSQSSSAVDLFLFVCLFAVALSTASVGVFGNFNWEGIITLAGNQPCYEVYSWPWHTRVIASLLTACALLSSIVYEWRTRDREPDSDDKVMIIQAYDDEENEEDDEEFEEYGHAV